MGEEIEETNMHLIYITQIKRVEGDRDLFKNLKNQFLLLYCAEILKGLPQWALEVEKEEMGDDEAEEEQKEDPAEDPKAEEAVEEKAKEVEEIDCCDIEAERNETGSVNKDSYDAV